MDIIVELSNEDLEEAATLLAEKRNPELQVEGRSEIWFIADKGEARAKVRMTRRPKPTPGPMDR